MKYKCVVMLVLCMALPITAHATSPMISGIANQTVQMNSATDVLSFTISDNDNSPYELSLTYRSSNRTLVPATDDNIILGGSGTNRTVKVIPAAGKSGTAVITITVTDLDGDSTDELFTVEVQRPPR